MSVPQREEEDVSNLVTYDSEFQTYKNPIEAAYGEIGVSSEAIKNAIEVIKYLGEHKDLTEFDHEPADGIILKYDNLQIELDNDGDSMVFRNGKDWCFDNNSLLIAFLGSEINK